MSEYIVVGIDGSKGSIAALKWAVALGRRRGLDVQPVWVWRYPLSALFPYPVGYPVPSDDVMQKDAEAAAEAFLAAVGDLDNGEVAVLETIVERGDAGPSLCKRAEGASVLVVGSRGRSALRAFALGSVSTYCAKVCPVPVAIVPEHFEGEEVGSRIMVGTDGSANAAQAVQFATLLAGPPNGANRDVEVRVVHAWTTPPPSMNDGWIDRDAMREIAEMTLASASTDSTDPRVMLELVNDDPRNVFEDRAADVDVLVVGAQGHRGLDRLFIGSVAMSVIHNVQTVTVICPSAADNDD